ncbi:MAG: helix-turn-helix transcriptional regulator [Ignavibacteriaceae bacterium]|nr:helix-turn-helix transcriptional regulator [Ignavibacteriaceae bacterium]
MSFGDKLKQFAKQNYGSLTNLGEALNMSVGHLSQYVNDVSRPGMDFFVKLHNLGCDINWLLSESEDNKTGEVKACYDSTTLQENIHLKKEIKALRELIAKINKLTTPPGE